MLARDKRFLIQRLLQSKEKLSRLNYSQSKKLAHKHIAYATLKKRKQDACSPVYSK